MTYRSQQPIANVKQTKNKPFNKTSYEKQRNLETNHPNRNQYPFGYRHHAWSEFVLNRKCRNPLTTQNSKICGYLSHRRHLRAIIE